MTIRSRFLRGGLAAATLGAFALTGIGVLAGPASAAPIGTDTFALSQTTLPAAPSATNPIVPGGVAATNNTIAETATVSVPAVPLGVTFLGGAFTISFPANVTINSVVSTGWGTAPTCTPSSGSQAAAGTISCTGGAIVAGVATVTATTVASFSLNPSFDDLGATAWSSTLSNLSATTPTGGTITTTGSPQTVTAPKIVPEAAITTTLLPTPQTVIAGGNSYTQTLSLSNAGPSDATGISATVTAPTGTPTNPTTTNPTGCVGTGTIVCTPQSAPTGLLLAGAAATTFGFTWAVPAADGAQTLTTTASLTTDTTKVPPSPPTAPTLPGPTQTAIANVIQPLTLVKAGPASVTPGATSPNLQYTLTLGDTVPLTTVQLTDPLPTGLTAANFVSASKTSGPDAINCALSGTTVQCGTGAGGTAGALLGTGTDIIAVNLQVPSTYSTPSPIKNTATVKSTGTGQVDTVVSNTFSTTVTTMATLTLTKVQTSPSPTAAPPGNAITSPGTGTYTITITNSGPSEAKTVKVKDTLTTNTTPASTVALAQSGGPDTFTCGVTAGECTIAKLPVGTVDTFVATVSVPALVTGTAPSITDSVTATTATTLTTPVVPQTVTTPINQGADLTTVLKVPKHFGTTPQPLQVTFGIKNLGPLAGAQPTVTITLPMSNTATASGVSFGGLFATADTPAGATCTGPKPTPTGVPPVPPLPAVTETITCTLAGPLASGKSATWTLNLFYPVQTAVSPNPVTLSETVGEVPTAAQTATSVIFDPNTGNNTATGVTTSGSPASPPAPAPTPPAGGPTPVSPPPSF